LWQAEHVAARLRAEFPQWSVELHPMSTRGDKLLDAPLAKLGGKGLFVKELEQSLLEGRADIAVHSMKDVPVELPDALHIAAILEREDPRDALVSDRFAGVQALPPHAVIGTSSLRRQCQLRAHVPECRWISLRGNVNTRLAKLASRECDAVVLAAAGLKRLGLAHVITQFLDAEVCLPAIGQGALGIECRRDDAPIHELLTVLHHEPTAVCVQSERALNERLQGGCQVPIAGYAEWSGAELRLRGLVAAADGGTILCSERRGDASAARDIGVAVAEDLLAQGADRILRDMGVR
jgi:hydroxymethylbilane synthase